MEFKEERELIERYLAGITSDEEDQQIETWYNSHAQKLPGKPENIDYDYLKAGAHMWGAVRPKPVKKLFPYGRVAVAALVLLVAGAGLWFYSDKAGFSDSLQEVVSPGSLQVVNDIAPGKNAAMLTLANGEVINLSDAKNGILALEQQINIRKTGDGQLIYSAGISSEALVYNTMTTPKAGKYTLILADGTIATLDAESSITYPVAFGKKERRVKMTGQVYFQVVHNAGQPFRVDVKDQMIEDLGTEFNINAYDDETIMKTTLIEGSARVIYHGSSALLSPGQQAAIHRGAEKISVNKVDTEEATAWKNGYFLFNNEPLESVMRKISRWYDVDVVYPSVAPIGESYLGSITRYSNVSKVLQMLEITGDVKFRIEGKKIIVVKKSNTDK